MRDALFSNKSGVIALSIMLLTLSGCDSVRNTFGLDHYQADAFTVPTNPPLTLPPDYNLRPPAPGTGPRYAVASSDQAQRTLGLPQSTDRSSTAAFIARDSSHTTPENIREVVDQEAREDSTLTGQMGQKMKSWKAEAKENLGSIFQKDETPSTTKS